MVPVRKPGRPLSSCPHPASRPCNCGQVTAAIPKKQKCGCGTNNGNSSQDHLDEECSSNESTPQTPIKGTNPSYRVQKTAHKNSTSSRKASVDMNGLGRMDASQVNILPAYNNMGQKPGMPPNGSMGSVPETLPYGPMFVNSAEATFNPMVYHMFPPPILPTPMLSPEASKSMIDGHSSTTKGDFVAPEFNQTSDSSPKKGSCCGGGTKSHTNGLETTKPLAAASSPETESKSKVKSCCSSKNQSPPPERTTEGFSAAGAPVNGIMMSPYQTPLVVPGGIYPYFPHPTIFTYPPQYGSYMQPLQPEQWRQIMAAMSFGHGMMPQASCGIPGPEAFQQSETLSSSAGTSHQCGCGDGCQCVGCAAHPYNEATQSYVRSAWESMTEEHQRPRSQTNGTPDQNYGHIQSDGDGTPEGSGTNGSSKEGAVTTTVSGDGTISPIVSQTPSEAASAMSEEQQSLSANDFFFVSYPFEDSCAGEAASCPCGDDCQCLDCVIHGNHAVHGDQDPATAGQG